MDILLFVGVAYARNKQGYFTIRLEALEVSEIFMNSDLNQIGHIIYFTDINGSKHAVDISGCTEYVLVEV